MEVDGTVQLQGWLEVSGFFEEGTPGCAGSPGIASAPGRLPEQLGGDELGVGPGKTGQASVGAVRPDLYRHLADAEAGVEILVDESVVARRERLGHRKRLRQMTAAELIDGRRLVAEHVHAHLELCGPLAAEEIAVLRGAREPGAAQRRRVRRGAPSAVVGLSSAKAFFLTSVMPGNAVTGIWRLSATGAIGIPAQAARTTAARNLAPTETPGLIEARGDRAR